MAEEEKDLKEGEEKTPTGDDQSDKKTPDLEEDLEEGEEPSDEKVEISKPELEQLKKDAEEKENYRKAVIRLNRERGRRLPGSEPEKKPKAKIEEEEFGADEEEKMREKMKGEFVTKEELTLRDEQAAISEACRNEEIALNWDEIIVFYIPPKENSYTAKLAGILKAHKLWRADKGLTEKPEKTEEEKKKEKEAKDLATEKGLSKGKEKKPKPEKKSIIPKKEKMEDWYSGEGK